MNGQQEDRAMALSATIDKLIELSTKLHAAQKERNKDAPDRCSFSEMLVFNEKLPEEIAIAGFFEGLKAAEIYMMTAIMYLGRGDIDTSDGMLEQYEQMSDTFKQPQWAAQQMVDKSTALVGYLQRGLKILQNEKVDSLLS